MTRFAPGDLMNTRLPSREGFDDAMEARISSTPFRELPSKWRGEILGTEVTHSERPKILTSNRLAGSVLGWITMTSEWRWLAGLCCSSIVAIVWSSGPVSPISAGPLPCTRSMGWMASWQHFDRVRLASLADLDFLPEPEPANPASAPRPRSELQHPNGCG